MNHSLSVPSFKLRRTSLATRSSLSCHLPQRARSHTHPFFCHFHLIISSLWIPSLSLLPTMTDHVRTRQSIARTASLDEKNIFFYRPDPSKFRMSGSLNVPRELVEAQTELLKMGYQTIGAMKQLMRRREIRYWALCPNSEGNVYDEHVASMIRLVTWGKDMNPADPTISSAPKIPQE